MPIIFICQISWHRFGTGESVLNLLFPTPVTYLSNFLLHTLFFTAII